MLQTLRDKITNNTYPVQVSKYLGREQEGGGNGCDAVAVEGRKGGPEKGGRARALAHAANIGGTAEVGRRRKDTLFFASG